MYRYARKTCPNLAVGRPDSKAFLHRLSLSFARRQCTFANYGGNRLQPSKRASFSPAPERRAQEARLAAMSLGFKNHSLETSQGVFVGFYL
jgi:hypothetical protein